jgi:hypothetical protein
VDQSGPIDPFSASSGRDSELRQTTKEHRHGSARLPKLGEASQSEFGKASRFEFGEASRLKREDWNSTHEGPLRGLYVFAAPVETRRRGLERQEEIKVKVTGFLIKCSELAPAARESQVGKLAGGCGGRKVSCSGSTTPVGTNK